MKSYEATTINRNWGKEWVREIGQNLSYLLYFLYPHKNLLPAGISREIYVFSDESVGTRYTKVSNNTRKGSANVQRVRTIKDKPYRCREPAVFIPAINLFRLIGRGVLYEERTVKCQYTSFWNLIMFIVSNDAHTRSTHCTPAAYQCISDDKKLK